MSETFAEQVSRVRLMASGDETWDLTPNDIAALKAVLAALDKRPVAPPLTAGPPLIDPHREHLAFVAVMNALDVHMPPDGAALLTELRAIAATVGYPWRGAPLTAGPVHSPDVEQVVKRIRMWLVQSYRYTASTLELDEVLRREIGTLLPAGPVAPPPDPLTRYQADLLSDWRCAQHSMMCECHPGREWPHDECPGPGMPWIIEGRTLIEEVLGEALRGAAHPPHPPQTLEVIVNGQPVTVDAGPVRRVIAEAIRRANQIGAPLEQWVLRTTDGEVIPHHALDGTDYELAPGKRLWLHLGVPARPPASPPEGNTNDHAQTPVSSLHAPIRDPLCPPLHDGGDGLRDTGPMGTGRVGPPASPPALEAEHE